MLSSESAFPIYVNATENDKEQFHFGVSKFEYFSSMALQGILARPRLGTLSAEDAATQAAEYADALLLEIEAREHK